MSGPKKWGWDEQWEAQRGLCWICLQPMRTSPKVHPLTASIEHIVPLSRGGGHGWRNKLLAHQGCNCARGAPFIWVKLSLFRRLAMARVQGLVVETTVEGVDLMGSHPAIGRKATGAIGRSVKRSSRLARVPSEMASKALRVSLAELSPASFPSTSKPEYSPEKT